MPNNFAIDPKSSQGKAILRIGACPEMGNLFENLVTAFVKLCDQQEADFTDIHLITLHDHDELYNQALGGSFDVILPDSTLRLNQLEMAWQEQRHNERDFIKEYTIFAVSPIVIVMRASIARSLGYPQHTIGWRDLAELATQEDEQFMWSRPTSQSGVGLLTTIAELYIAARKSSEISEEALSRPEVVKFVQDLERAITEYGTSAEEVASRAIQDGQWRVDAFVVPEQIALRLSAVDMHDPPVIIYPKEGTSWVEYALAFCSSTLQKRIGATYEVFRNYLLSADAQAQILARGLRPAGPHYEAYLKTAPHRPLQQRRVTPVSAVALSAPSPTLQKYASGLWRGVKRHTNVFLVVDISGSMKGEKLANAQQGLEAFVKYLDDNQEAAGLVVFNDTVTNIVPLDQLTRNTSHLLHAIQHLRASGRTALLDAIYTVHQKLQHVYDPERIQAIVVMTDGQENASRLIDHESLLRHIDDYGRSRLPIVVYCIAYGKDAALDKLHDIASASSGAVYQGTLDNIRRTYEKIAHFL